MTNFHFAWDISAPASIFIAGSLIPIELFLRDVFSLPNSLAEHDLWPDHAASLNNDAEIDTPAPLR